MPSRRAAERALEQLPIILEAASIVRSEAVELVDQAARLADPNLTPRGLAQRQEEMRTEARVGAAPRFDALREQWDTTAATIREYADGFRPEFPTDARGLQSVGITWEGVRRRIEAGRPLTNLIHQTTSTEVLLALREWGPDYLRALGEEPETFDASPLEDAVDRRLAELGDGRWMEALQWVDQLEVHEAVWRIWRAHDVRFVRGLMVNTAVSSANAKFTSVAAANTMRAARDGGLASLHALVAQGLRR